MAAEKEVADKVSASLHVERSHISIIAIAGELMRRARLMQPGQK